MKPKQNPFHLRPCLTENSAAAIRTGEFIPLFGLPDDKRFRTAENRVNRCSTHSGLTFKGMHSHKTTQTLKWQPIPQSVH